MRKTIYRSGIAAFVALMSFRYFTCASQQDATIVAPFENRSEKAHSSLPSAGRAAQAPCLESSVEWPDETSALRHLCFQYFPIVAPLIFDDQHILIAFNSVDLPEELPRKAGASSHRDLFSKRDSSFVIVAFTLEGYRVVSKGRCPVSTPELAALARGPKGRLHVACSGVGLETRRDLVSGVSDQKWDNRRGGTWFAHGSPSDEMGTFIWGRAYRLLDHRVVRPPSLLAMVGDVPMMVVIDHDTTLRSLALDAPFHHLSVVYSLQSNDSELFAIGKEYPNREGPDQKYPNKDGPYRKITIAQNGERKNDELSLVSQTFQPALWIPRRWSQPSVEDVPVFAWGNQNESHVFLPISREEPLDADRNNSLRLELFGTAPVGGLRAFGDGTALYENEDVLELRCTMGSGVYVPTHRKSRQGRVLCDGTTCLLVYSEPLQWERELQQLTNGAFHIERINRETCL